MPLSPITDEHATPLWERSGASPRNEHEAVADPGDGAPDPDRARTPGCRPVAPVAPRPALTLVGGAAEQSTRWFCGYCGAPAAGAPPTPLSRVCGVCAEGLLLEAPADAAPRAGNAFLVVDSRLTVQAVSRGAEEILGIREPDVIDQPLSELLWDADSELDGPHSFATAVTETALSDETGWSAFVRPRKAFGIRMRARITHCGPPRAALIVLERRRSPAPRLRLVQAERTQGNADGA